MRMGLEKTGAGTGAGLGRGNGVWLSGAVKERKGRPVLPARIIQLRHYGMSASLR